jgi:hypothetical protein
MSRLFGFLGPSLIGLIWSASSPEAGPQPQRPSSARVLFFGNSLTAAICRECSECS